jgi:hypothetical protein
VFSLYTFLFYDLWNAERQDAEQLIERQKRRDIQYRWILRQMSAWTAARVSTALI